jgi:hypothetical protein
MGQEAEFKLQSLDFDALLLVITYCNVDMHHPESVMLMLQLRHRIMLRCSIVWVIVEYCQMSNVGVTPSGWRYLAPLQVDIGVLVWVLYP